MSPGLRLLVAPLAALVGALACYALPPRATRRSLLVAGLATAVAAAVLVSVLSELSGGRTVERGFGTLVRGVPLGVRGDETGTIVCLLAAALAAAVLTGPPRRPLERSALLLCLAGTCAVALAPNLYLIVGGLELGNVGALLLTAAATADPVVLRRAKLAFGVQHLASLGLLAGALRLTVDAGTADPAALPAGALSAWAAVPWAVSGALRLGAAAGLPAVGGGGRVSAAWLSVAAVPSGLVTLLRLEAAGGAGGIPAEATDLLGAAGVALAVGGAIAALLSRRGPAGAGRGLLVALGGQVVIAVTAGSPAALTAAAGLAVGLALAAAAAPAWETRRHSTAGRAAAALGLLAAAALPAGAGTAGLLAATGAEAAPGTPHSLLAIAAAAAALVAALAGARAAAGILRTVAVPPSAVSRPLRTRLRLDALLPLAAGAALGALPGTLLGGLADRIAGSQGAITAVDSGAVRGPGFAWAGGYLEAGLVLAVVALGSAMALQGVVLRASRPAPLPVATGGGVARPVRAPGVVARVGRAIDTVDRWLTTQPDVPALVLGAAAALFWFGFRR